MLKTIYTQLKAELLNVQGVAVVDWYTGLFQDQNGALVHNTPALFVEFLPIQFETLQQGLQTTQVQFNVHTVHECLYDNDERMTDPTIDHLGMVEAVFVMLQGKTMLNTNGNPILSSIMRTALTPDHGLGELLVTTQSFAGEATDNAAYSTSAQAPFNSIIINK